MLACIWPLVTTAQTTETPGTHYFLENATTTDLFVASSSVPTYTPKQLVMLAFPDAPVMLRIAAAESSFIPTQKNPASTATGLFQILIGTWQAYHCTGTRTNAADNIACARKIYDAQGTTPWMSSKAGWE